MSTFLASFCDQCPKCTITLNRFHEALIKYGVEKHELFQTNDLSEKKDIANVTNTLFALGRAVGKIKFCSG